jgi:hypothetical protein
MLFKFLIMLVNETLILLIVYPSLFVELLNIKGIFYLLL